MHRTTTTATLLVTMALSALTGCVTVQRPSVPGPPAPGPPTAPVQQPQPRQDGRPQQRIVQAPALEALERSGPSREAAPIVPATRRPAAPAPERGQRPPERSRPAPRPRPQRPEAHRPRRPRVELPVMPEQIHTDVCALGKKHGSWRENSPEATICGQPRRR